MCLYENATVISVVIYDCHSTDLCQSLSFTDGKLWSAILVVVQARTITLNQNIRMTGKNIEE